MYIAQLLYDIKCILHIHNASVKKLQNKGFVSINRHNERWLKISIIIYSYIIIILTNFFENAFGYLLVTCDNSNEEFGVKESFSKEIFLKKLYILPNR